MKRFHQEQKRLPPLFSTWSLYWWEFSQNSLKSTPTRTEFKDENRKFSLAERTNAQEFIWDFSSKKLFLGLGFFELKSHINSSALVRSAKENFRFSSLNSVRVGVDLREFWENSHQYKDQVENNGGNLFSVFSYAIVRALSDEVWGAITFDGVGRSCSFMARSIAYDPRTPTTKGFFLGWS